MLLWSLTLQDGCPRYREDSGMDSCRRKRLWMVMATFSISQSTLTASVSFSRRGGSWGPWLVPGTEAALVPAGVGSCSGPGPRKGPGAWVVLPGKLPARHKEMKPKSGSVFRDCHLSLARAARIGGGGRETGVRSDGNSSTHLDCTFWPESHPGTCCAFLPALQRGLAWLAGGSHGPGDQGALCPTPGLSQADARCGPSLWTCCDKPSNL